MNVDAMVLQRRHSPIMWSVLVYVVSPVLVRRWCIGERGNRVITTTRCSLTRAGFALSVSPSSDGLHNIKALINSRKNALKYCKERELKAKLFTQSFYSS